MCWEIRKEVKKMKTSKKKPEIVSLLNWAKAICKDRQFDERQVEVLNWDSEYAGLFGALLALWRDVRLLKFAGAIERFTEEAQGGSSRRVMATEKQLRKIGRKLRNK